MKKKIVSARQVQSADTSNRVAKMAITKKLAFDSPICVQKLPIVVTDELSDTNSFWLHRSRPVSRASDVPSSLFCAGVPDFTVKLSSEKTNVKLNKKFEGFKSTSSKSTRWNAFSIYQDSRHMLAVSLDE